ncbi:hypothetical protein BJ165DRAFT_1598315 [Panaeolus papilionaceus]|nr:hypothetical protein BJ165DRAFT_1598315 [Panaeolus papilionaceus]
MSIQQPTEQVSHAEPPLLRVRWSSSTRGVWYDVAYSTHYPLRYIQDVCPTTTTHGSRGASDQLPILAVSSLTDGVEKDVNPTGRYPPRTAVQRTRMLQPQEKGVESLILWSGSVDVRRERRLYGVCARRNRLVLSSTYVQTICVSLGRVFRRGTPMNAVEVMRGVGRRFVAMACGISGCVIWQEGSVDADVEEGCQFAEV